MARLMPPLAPPEHRIPRRHPSSCRSLWCTSCCQLGDRVGWVVATAKAAAPDPPPLNYLSQLASVESIVRICENWVPAVLMSRAMATTLLAGVIVSIVIPCLLELIDAAHRTQAHATSVSSRSSSTVSDAVAGVGRGAEADAGGELGASVGGRGGAEPGSDNGTNDAATSTALRRRHSRGTRSTPGITIGDDAPAGTNLGTGGGSSLALGAHPAEGSGEGLIDEGGSGVGPIGDAPPPHDAPPAAPLRRFVSQTAEELYAGSSSGDAGACDSAGGIGPTEEDSDEQEESAPANATRVLRKRGRPADTDASPATRRRR